MAIRRAARFERGPEELQCKFCRIACGNSRGAEAGPMWYSASLLYESVHNQMAREESIWEEQIVLISADTDAEARAQAELIGKNAEVMYTSATQDQVRWAFREVQSVFQLLDQELKSGAEVFSRFLRASEARSLLTPFEEEMKS